MTATRDRESEALAARLVACLPAASFEMETLCRLVAVTASRGVPTAAVSCGDRPRLLVNPDFVATHCQRDEHLFLLVMHELWHIILAHTTVYPRVTPAHNIAFDAVINAGLARQFQSPEYRGFFEAINPTDDFPGLLLRPPEGWPTAPVYPEVTPRVGRILRQLYPPPLPPGAEEQSAMPTYEEIVELLAAVPLEGGATLLGDHGDPEGEERLTRAGALADVVRDIVSRWPPPPFPLGGRDAGGEQRGWEMTRADPAAAARSAFARILLRLLGPRPGSGRRRRARVEVQGGSGVLPNPRDRMAPARRLLGCPGSLWAQPTPVPCRVPDPARATLVYLDVSGSMAAVLPHLVGLLVPYVAARRATVTQFSTEVSPLTLADLQRGELTTTYGTSVDPVLRHALADRAARRVLVVTDGYTGRPGAEVAAAVAARGLRVHVVLPAERAFRDDLADVAASMTVLPPITRRRRP